MSDEKWSYKIVIRYTILQLLELIVVIGILYVIGILINMPLWISLPIVIAWIFKDVILFPLIWRAYDWDHVSTEDPMKGMEGIVTERIAPTGYIMIHGELWRAQGMEKGLAIEKGQKVRVFKVKGLTLYVQPLARSKSRDAETGDQDRRGGGGRGNTLKEKKWIRSLLLIGFILFSSIIILGKSKMASNVWAEEDIIPAREDQYDIRIKKLDILIGIDDENADAYFNRGWLYAVKGDLLAAKKDYSRAIEINREYSDAYYNRGLIYINMKKFQDAIKDFSKVIELNPGAVDAYCNRANAYFQMGNIDLALDDYEAALKIDPYDPDLIYNRGVVLISLGENKRALTDLNKAAQMGHEEARRYLERFLDTD